MFHSHVEISLEVGHQSYTFSCSESMIYFFGWTTANPVDHDLVCRHFRMPPLSACFGASVDRSLVVESSTGDFEMTFLEYEIANCSNSCQDFRVLTFADSSRVVVQ